MARLPVAAPVMCGWNMRLSARVVGDALVRLLRAAGSGSLAATRRAVSSAAVIGSRGRQAWRGEARAACEARLPGRSSTWSISYSQDPAHRGLCVSW